MHFKKFLFDTGLLVNKLKLSSLKWPNSSVHLFIYFISSFILQHFDATRRPRFVRKVDQFTSLPFSPERSKSKAKTHKSFQYFSLLLFVVLLFVVLLFVSVALWVCLLVMVVPSNTHLWRHCLQTPWEQLSADKWTYRVVRKSRHSFISLEIKRCVQKWIVTFQPHSSLFWCHCQNRRRTWFL